MIACRMAFGVIDLFEEIEIDLKKREGRVTCDGVSKRFLHRAAVVKTRQRIGHCLDSRHTPRHAQRRVTGR